MIVPFDTKEGRLRAIVLLVLPFVILYALIKILPPWQEEAAATLQSRWQIEKRVLARLPGRRAAFRAVAGQYSPASRAKLGSIRAPGKQRHS